jgi:hypothetical protein
VEYEDEVWLDNSDSICPDVEGKGSTVGKISLSLLVCETRKGVDWLISDMKVVTSPFPSVEN